MNRSEACHKAWQNDTPMLAKHIRKHALMMTNRGNTAHIGSILSMTDIIAVLYGAVMRFDAAKPDWIGRDRFILSKGHAAAGVYAALAECGFFSTDILKSHCQSNSPLCGHLTHKPLPGIEHSTGSLGHGLSVACGRAYSLKKSGSDSRVFVVMGDGECDEGAIWEAALFAAHHQLDNLVVIIDRNHLQSMTTTENTVKLEPFADKWRAFGWAVDQLDGHDHTALNTRLTTLPFRSNQPNCLIANTVKGCGVGFMENQVLWHYRSPQGSEFIAACHALEHGDNSA
ncbi:MAG: transketolase [Magnetococcales bacterium]|nr:transketolase [Magnetococcales bacterium]